MTGYIFIGLLIFIMILFFKLNASTGKKNKQGTSFHSGVNAPRPCPGVPRYSDTVQATYKPRKPEDQLQIVSSPTVSFEKQRLMNKEEYRLFMDIDRYLTRQHQGYRVFPQVSMGEFLKSASPDAYASVNSKRVDVLVIDCYGTPCAVVEYQGGGHYQGNATRRDAVKKEACRKAGIGFIEIAPGYDDSDIAQLGKYMTVLH